MSPFARASAGLAAAVDSAAAVAVEVRRPSTGQSVCIMAVPGTTEHQTFDADGFPIRTRSADWLFPADALRFDGVTAIEPEEGFEFQPVGGTAVYRCVPFGSNRQSWRYSDPANTRVRVHTKRTNP